MTNGIPTNKLYDRLKILGLVVLPSLSSTYFAISELWGWPYESQITGTIAIANVFVGVMVTRFRKIHNDKNNDSYDGTLAWKNDDSGNGGSSLHLTELDFAALTNKNIVTLRIERSRLQE